MKIMAKFIGTDSLGYKHGEVYTLTIDRMTITRMDGTGYCPYTSLESFLRNWDLLAHDK